MWRRPVKGHSSCWTEVHDTPVPTGAPSTGLWKERPVRKLSSVTSRATARADTTRGLLTFVMDRFRSEVQDTILP